MPFIYSDRVQETTTTTGTGDLTLGGVPDATYQAFSARMANGDTTTVGIFGAGAYEVCDATWNTGGTLTRGTIHSSSNADARVNFGTGTKTVVMTLSGALGRRVVFPNTSHVRQTIQTGPADANGIPTFFPATSASLTVTTQNISATAPLTISAAGGFDARGAVNRVGILTSNVSFTAVASATSFPYFEVADNGTVTQGVSTLAPIYQEGGSPSTANGQFTFIWSEMKGYVGNGTVATQVWRVYAGELVAGASSVTSTRAYAYRGFYESAWTTPLPGVAALVTRDHNIGVVPRRVQITYECLTAEHGYAVGDIVDHVSTAPTTNQELPIPIVKKRTTASFRSGAAAAFYTIHAGTGGQVVLTAANWRYKVLAWRD